VLQHQARHFCAFLHASSLPLTADRRRISGADASLPAATPHSCSGLSTGNLVRRQESSFPDTRFLASSFPTQGLRLKVADKTSRRRCAAAKLSGKDDDGRGTATEGAIPLPTSCYKKA
jgi:hypothetical protein